MYCKFFPLSYQIQWLKLFTEISWNELDSVKYMSLNTVYLQNFSIRNDFWEFKNIRIFYHYITRDLGPLLDGYFAKKVFFTLRLSLSVFCPKWTCLANISSLKNICLLCQSYMFAMYMFSIVILHKVKLEKSTFIYSL